MPVFGSGANPIISNGARAFSSLATAKIIRSLFASASTLTDNFDDNSEAAAWDADQVVYNAGDVLGGTIVEQNQRLEMTPTATGVSTSKARPSAANYDFTNDAVFARFTPASAVPSGQQFYLWVGIDSSNSYFVVEDAGSLFLFKQVAGAYTNYGSIAYNSTTHAWLRLRHNATGDTINLDTYGGANDPPLSGDWVNQVSHARDGIAVTSVKHGPGVRTYSSVTPVAIYVDGYNTGTTTVSNAISGTASLTLTGTATLLGQGAITGSSTLLLSPSATLTGTGAIVGSSTLVLSPSATLLGKGAVSGSSVLTFAPVATLLGSGAVSGSSTLVFAPSATLLGIGAIAGSTTATFAPTATLLGKGALVGSSSLSFAGSAALGATTFISGSAALSLGVSGLLSGRGQVAGVTNVSFSLFGTLSVTVSTPVQDDPPPLVDITPSPVPAGAALVQGVPPALIELTAMSQPSFAGLTMDPPPPLIELEGE